MNDDQRATLARLEKRISELPVLPAVVVELLHLQRSDDHYFDRVLGAVNRDPAFATRLLQFANSAAIGSPRPITSTSAALLRVGARAAVEMILAHSAAKIFLPRHEWERGLWVHAVMVACLMRRLAPLCAPLRIDPESAYLFGLLHDIGRFVLYLEAPDDLRAVDETDWADPTELVRAEISICGFTHAELGYLALKKWELPNELALAIRFHHTRPFPPPGLPEGFVAMTKLLQDADWIAVTAARRGIAFCRPPAAEFRVVLEKGLAHPFARTLDEVVLAIDEALQEAARGLTLLDLALA
jgi:putative nucleotidyltransferase with HDIG domain